MKPMHEAPRTTPARTPRRVVLRAALALLLLAGTLVQASTTRASTGDHSPAATASPASARSADTAPSTHPRLWIRAADLPRLRAWATDRNPIYRDGLAVVAARARMDMDRGLVPARDTGGVSYEEYPTESYAELFAFMSLVSTDPASRADYARRARTLLMATMGRAAQGPADGQPFRDPRFALSDRSRWYGEGFALTVDWIYPFLSGGDKATIRTVFLRWCDENLHAETTNDNHPEPLGVVNDPALVRDPIRVRYAGNNYYDAHMRNIGLMALALDPADDPGNRLRAYLRNATGAWLYVVDYLLRHDARGGLAPEGFEYGPQSLGYVLQFLLALHTAGQDDPAVYGPQVALASNPFWNDMVTAYLHSLSPAPTPYSYLGPVYQPAWYGDGQHEWASDPIQAFGTLGVYDEITGNTGRLAALRWIQTNMPPGGPAALTDRVRGASWFRDTILYFLLFDPNVAAPADPHPALPLVDFVPGIGHLLARTDWSRNATWFDYSLGWLSIDHQNADGNAFELYRHGEWLTKARIGYGLPIGASDYHNTLAIENSPPAHNEADDYRHDLWQRGSQWVYGNAQGDGQILAHSAGRGYVYALGDATALYNSATEGATDVTEADRSIVWLQPDYVVVYDRAATRTSGRFKRFWLQLPALPAISGHRANVITPGKQHLYVTTLLPANATLTSSADEALNGEAAEAEPMHFRLQVEAPGSPSQVRFLHVLQGADPGAPAAATSLVQCNDGTPFAGALIDGTLVLFPVDLRTPFQGLTCTAPAGTRAYLITGLMANGSYSFQLRGTSQGTSFSVRAGAGSRADSGGVLAAGTLALASTSPTQAPGRPTAAKPVAARTATPTPAIPTARPTARRTSATKTPPPTPRPSTRENGTGGHITYRLTDGHVFRVAAQANAVPQDVSAALDRIAPGSGDQWLNTSANGGWLVLSTQRFDPGCAGWACLALVKGDLTGGTAVRAGGQLVHPDGFGAVSSNGNLIVYSAGGGPHQRDLYAVARNGNSWSSPLLLSRASPYAFNEQPAVSYDGRSVVFECGPRPYGDTGTALCVVGTGGQGFHISLTPTNPPPGQPRTGLLQQPGYGPDGSIVFEGDYAREQIWRLPAGAIRPQLVGSIFNNDNDPCVLPDGRIASLWLERSGGGGNHEIKVMTADGSRYIMALTGVDVADIGIGCGQ